MEDNILTYEEASEIIKGILIVSAYDEEAEELFSDLIETAQRYQQARISWVSASLAERAKTDASRVMLHDSLIVKFNQLSRYGEQCGEDNGWRKLLGDEKDPECRKRIGDMGCWLCLFQSIAGR